MIFNNFLIVFLLIISLPLSFLQGTNISGYVRDNNTNDALLGANVFIDGTTLGTATSKDGYYKITNVKEGSYIVKAAYIGYQTSIDSINIIGDQDISLNFNLNYSTIEGKEVTVTAQAKGQMDAINKQLNARSLVKFSLV